MLTRNDILDLKRRHSEELAQFREGLYVRPRLRQLFFELTLKCNEACFHCGSSCGAARPDGLPAEDYKSVLDEVKQNFDIRQLMLCITGGEPLLRPDFFDILGYAHEQGYTWGMTTNATLITPDIAHRLYETGMATVSISIDGLEKTHDRLRGLDGGYRLAMDGIENLLAERERMYAAADGKGTDRKGQDGKDPGRKDPDGKGPDGKDPDRKDPDRKDPDGKASYGKSPDGKGPLDAGSGKGVESPADTEIREDAKISAGKNPVLKKRPLRVIQVTTVINHETIGQLDALYRIFEDMDIDSWRVIGLEPIGRALLRPELMLTPEDQRRLFSFIYEKRCEQIPVTYGCSHFLGFDYEREVRDWYFLCNAGIYTASIMANGDVGACLDIERSPRTVQGNIFETPFTEIWNNRFALFRQPLSRFCADCTDCSYERYCAGGAHHSFDYENGRQRICLKGILFD